MNQKYSITIDVGADITKARAAMADLQKIFNTQNLGAGQSNRLTSMFADLSKVLDELESKSGKTFSSLGEIKGVDKVKQRVSSLITDISREFSKIQDMGNTDLGKNFKGLSDNLNRAGEAFKTYESAISKIKKRQDELSGYIKKTNEEYKDQREAQKKYVEFRKNLPEDLKGKQQSGVRSYLSAQLESAQKESKKAQEELDNYINQKGYSNVFTKAGNVRKNQSYSEDNDLLNLVKNAKQAQEAVEGATKSLDDFNKITKNLKSETDIKKIGDDLKQAQEELAKLTSGELNEEAFNKLKTSLSSIFGEDLFKDIQNSENAVEQFKDKIDSISADKIAALKEQFPEMNSLLEQMGVSAQKAGTKIDDAFSSATKAEQMGREIDVLGSRLKYFFSLAGGFNLMRRAIRSAVTTTKELDAVMTQTAVVSEYTVGDMWKTLPQYSKEAKRLGAVIKDVYSAQTLYVQQGLNMNDAMDLGVETLKMARVAGIGAEEATNSMTAALRGFNMELNESSAVRINDVYSKLAQNTASNVQEISTAMTKTAALANSANMSFENTAAFLATIIESTREGAETAGTALKTVIARFTEVKKLYDEGELTGTDEEGQEVDVNKISKALRTAGINMNDFFTGAKGLDEIFMELGGKWDSLTTVQQRYIATMAAGSRQQSRFLALMQNYSRTVELTQMAYNSAGSGQEQFEKTLDSLEAKINRFKDTWDTFIMGIANSDLIKGAIDFGTDFLEILNNIINTISGDNGLIKSITSIGLAIGGFKIGRSLITRGGFLGSIISGKGIQAGERFGKTFTKGLGYALTKQAREKGEGVSNWAYQNFKFIKGDYLEVITKDNTDKVKQAYKDYQKEMERIDKSDVYKNMPGGQTARQSAKDLYKQNVYEKKQEENGLTKEQAQAIIDNKGIQKTTKDYNALGNTVLALGGAFVALGAAIDGIAGKSTKAGSVLKGLGSGAMIAGAALKGAAAAAELFGSALATALGVVGVAIGVITAIASIYDTFNESESEKRERLKKELEESGENLTSLKNKYKELEESIDSLTEKEDAFKGLIKGTKEWDSAVKDLNTSIQTLVSNYPELVRAIKYNENGTLSLDEDIVKEVQKEYKDKVRDATYRNIGAKNALTYSNYQARNYNISEKIGRFDIFTANVEDEISKKVKETLREGINEGLLSGLSEYSREDILQEGSVKRNDVINLLSSYLVSKGYNKDSIFEILNDDYLLEGAIGKELSRQNKETYDKELLANSFELRDEIINEIFSLESGAIKTLALRGTEDIYTKAAEAIDFKSLSKTEQDNIRLEFASIIGGQRTGEGKYLVNGETVNIGDEQAYGAVLSKKAAEATEEAAKATENWLVLQSKQVQDFVSGLGKRTDLLPDSVVQQILQDLDSIDGLFTSKEVNQNWQQKYNEIDEKINEATGDILTPILDQIDNISKDIEVAKHYRASEEQIKQLEEKRQELIDSIFGGLSISSYEKIGQLITVAGTNYGATKAANLFAILSEGISKYSGTDEQRNKFASALYEVDWKTIDSIDEFSLALEELGISVDIANDFKELADALLETQKAIKTFNLKELQKNAKEILDLRDNLKSAANATFDEDTYKKLLQYGVDRSKFTYTGQGYTYTGGLVKDLDKVLQGYLQEEAKNTRDVLSQQIEEGKKLEAGREEIARDETIEKFFSGKLEKTDSETISAIFQALGFGDTGLYNEQTGQKVLLEDLTGQGVFELYTKYLDYLQNYKAKQVTLDEIDKNLPFYGRSNDYVRQYGGDTQQQVAAAKVDAERAGINIQELDAYAQKLQEVNNIEEAIAYAIAYDNMLMNQGLQQLISSYETWEKVLKAAQQDEAKKDTQEYTDTIVGLRQVVQKMTGTTAQFSEKFLTATDTLDLFKKAVKGDTDAINQLRKSAARDILPDLSELGQAGNYLNNWIDNVDLDNIKIGAELDTNVADVFQGLLDAGQVTAEQVNAALETIGYEPDIGTEVVTVGSGTQTHQNGYTTFTDVNGVTHTVKNEGGMDIGANQQIEVPIIGGSSKAKQMNSGRKAAQFKGGAGSTVNPSNKKSGGGGGGGKEFKNDFDKYYNQVEDINELERQRNLLEKDYDQLLKSESKSGKEIYDNLQRQLALLRERANLTADLAEKRKQQIIDTTQDEEYKDVAKYAWWNEADLTIEIDWDAIDQIKDSEQGDLVKEYVKKLEDFQSKYDDMIENLEDIESTIQEINERGKEEYQSLEDRTRDALIKQIQDKIDELSDVNESINDTNQKLFDSINETLQLQRQERTNAETEEELGDKEKRLAYLQQDSSNANQVEIAKLQKEIDDARQDYTDNLIDQKISELQRQNDEAANQRQQQIELMQRSLDWQEKSGAFWDEVYRLISEGTDVTGQLVRASELEQLLKQGEAWDSLSLEGQMGWLEKLEDEVAQGVAYLEMQRQLESIGTKEGAQISFTNASGQTLSGTVDKNGNVVVKNADGSTTTYKDVFQDYHGAYRTFESSGETKAVSSPATPTAKSTTTTTTGNGIKDNSKVPDEQGWYYDKTQHWHQYKNGGKYDIANHKFNDVEDNGDSLTYICTICGCEKRQNKITGKTSFIKYASGGLNTQTGLAWLDGTKSSPELVLNARDTQNFIELKDTLASIKSGNGLSLTGGDNYYDIKVQVDSLGSDYDVDRAIDRIKARIAQDGAYRNVNTLSRLR